MSNAATAPLTALATLKGRKYVHQVLDASDVVLETRTSPKLYGFAVLVGWADGSTAFVWRTKAMAPGAKVDYSQVIRSIPVNVVPPNMPTTPKEATMARTSTAAAKPAAATAAKAAPAKRTPAAKAAPKRTAGVNHPKGEGLASVSAVAGQLGIAPRTLRVWLRKQEKGTGRGTRYGFTPAEAKALVAEYTKAHSK